MTTDTLLINLWDGLGWPLLRLLFFISLGLLVANFIEALSWTRKIAFLARPLTRFGHLSSLTGASFSMAFFSGVAANTMLSEGYEQQSITKKELILANLFNSLPTYFLHLPTTFFITAPLIKGAAVIYVGLTFGAAVLRTLAIALLAHFLLPKREGEQAEEQQRPPATLKVALANTMKRFRRRIKKIIRFTVPIYSLFYFFNQAGVFARLELFMADHFTWLSWLSPQAMSIVVLHVAAEFSAGLAAAGAMLADGTMTTREIILALLVGNILSSPIRALRHQFPYYAGIFKPALASQLILFSQSFRTISIALMALLYFWFSR
ncbi:membrane protein [Desulfogranum mediterraneum]|uniref:membrane protein n=1 Tax=Desulfogranum mediterraneum TaxID=160661 RepID=UPI00040DAA58|nr:membrane protein [Desulfogranum mediterraneum]